MTLAPESTPHPLRGVDAIDEGDWAAARGDWPPAIEYWRAALESDERAAATERIGWFLDEAAPRKDRQIRLRDRVKDARMLLSTALASGVLATAMVLVAQGRSGAAASALASGAWLHYVASATLVVIYAYRTGRPTGRPSKSLTTSDMARAAQLAEALAVARNDEPSPA